MIAETLPIVLHFSPFIKFNKDQFYDFCRINQELKFEITAKGDLLVMAPTGGATGSRNSRLITALTNWSDKDGNGVVFDSSTGFILPDGSIRSPDVSWVKKDRLIKLTPEQKVKFLPLCPDFVVELRSENDKISDLQYKMQKYYNNGAELGWLIDPKERRIYIYESDAKLQCLENPLQISGGLILPGFTLNLKHIWETGF